MPTDHAFEYAPFTVIVDTREGAPYQFRTLRTNADKNGVPLVVPIEEAALGTGDYSIKGHEDRVAVERKSVDDFLNCCTNDRPRFAGPGGQLERLNEMPFATVVVEGTLEHIHEDIVRSGRKVHPRTIHRSLIAWKHRLRNLHWELLPGRDVAEAWTYRILERYWEDEVKTKGSKA